MPSVPFEKLQFDTEAPENVAIQDFIDFAESLVDDDGNEVFADVNFGWETPEGEPNEDTVPMLRIWCDQGVEVNDNQDYVLPNQGTRTLSIFFYFYAFGDTNIQAQKARLIDHFLRHLSDPAVLAKFHTDSWRFKFDPSNTMIDHSQALKRVADYFQLQHPWYASRVDIPIEIFRTYDA